MKSLLVTTLAGLALASLAGASGAATTLAGNLTDSGNTHLVGSDLGAPDFGNPAYNVALYTFSITRGGAVDIASSGFAGGSGVDPYFTLFAGSGDGATFLDSNYTQAYFGGGGDFDWNGTLSAGTYEIALGVFGNMSFAEQDVTPGTLGEGFIAIPNIDSLGDGSYVLTLTTPVPEPATSWLLALGLVAGGSRAWRARRGA
ncbi:DVUA0089 family protein [Scleromatobacter humisilvae]|uniref:DVUA0089 family protein n=1 Tax=Scleromatobacter humisilvae TaxID=2897159 RepID=A0A9X1YGR3_9BURK|nr:DVUA0089 family protein [Scleromatobacter humisilvae]MCK9684403.1 DVUA0089 family protein [Scleromatobacter humisilvae]